MFRVDIGRWVPKFILNDKNGYALAKAIEAALNSMNANIRKAVGVLLYVDEMPEWRLDELAEELDCLYDYDADIESKRIWIKNAIPYYRIYGTPNAIKQFLNGYFDSVEVEENWNYGGEPFHFRVTVEEEWNPSNEEWARKAIERAKNVRSVLDSLRAGCHCSIAIMAEPGTWTKFSYPMTGDSQKTGTWPNAAHIGVIDKPGLAADASGEGTNFPYTETGTIPGLAHIGSIDSASAAAEASIVEQKYPYQMTSADLNAGTVPDGNTIFGGSDKSIQAAKADDTYAAIVYKICGQDEI